MTGSNTFTNTEYQSARKNRFMKLEIENNIFSSALILYEFFHTTVFSSNVTTEQCSDSHEIVFITAYVSK